MKTIYQYFERTLLNNAVEPIEAYGNFLTLLYYSGTGNILISIAHQRFEELPQGLSIELPKDKAFDHIEFKNNSSATVTIRFSLSNGRIYDNRVVISGDLNVTDISNAIDTPPVFDLNAGNSYTNTITADADQKEVIIQNCGSFNIWVGDTSVNPALDRGIKLINGDVIVLSCTAAITVKSNSEITKFSIMRLKKV